MAKYFFLIGIASLILAAFAFARNQPNRHYINVQLQEASKAAGAQMARVPERQFSYDAVELNEFKDALGTRTAPFDRTALQFYLRPVLVWNDLMFAAGLGLFVAASWLWLIAILHADGVLRGALVALAAMGLLYTASDVAEDLYLRRILSKPTPVSETEAYIAQALTRAKFISIVLSVQGGAMFAILSCVFPEPVEARPKPE